MNENICNICYGYNLYLKLVVWSSCLINMNTTIEMRDGDKEG